MRVLVACEVSGKVRDAFIAKGHDAMSCDLVPSDSPGPHHVGDVRALLTDWWDLLIAFPPCTYLAASGAQWQYRDAGRRLEQSRAVDFVLTLWSAPIKRKAIENPVGALSRLFKPPTQIIQPWQFGDDASKTTCLWLDQLPPLRPTRLVPPKYFVRALPRWGNQSPSGASKIGPGPTCQKKRSETFSGVAQAMADQWSNVQTYSSGDLLA